MIRRLILGQIDRFERKAGASLDYARFMVRTSLRAFLKFAKFVKLSSYRRVLSADAQAVAAIVATRAADCGPCVQIAVSLARQSGASRDVLAAAVEQRPDDLPDALVDVYRFAEAVAHQRENLDDLRERIRSRFGDEGLVELALAIGFTTVFPVAKRALGYAVSCQRVTVHV